MRKIVKRVVGPALQKFSEIYFRKPRTYKFKEIAVTVPPGVFPPHLTISTKLLLEFVEPLDLHGKTFLELGCGCAIISVLAAKKGAVVTSTDINPDAVSIAEINAAGNGVMVDAIYSDLFQNLNGRTFDYIVINPPYYPRQPQSMAENAWFCGENFEYFEKLFLVLHKHLNPDGKAIMILSEDCDIQSIERIAEKNTIGFVKIEIRKVLGEESFIFRLAPKE